ncbi:MAG TPA: lasso peptide biosynthesis B2 protein [Longimicrobiales bacterium]
MISPRFAVCGAVAALVVPWHLGGPRLERLLADPADAGGSAAGRGRAGGRGGPGFAGSDDPAATEGRGPAAAVRAAHTTLRALARLPGSPWRNTCLYRAAAGCLALRWLGREATLRLGARRDAASDEVLAHAWIESPAVPAESVEGYRVLSRNARG